MEKLMQELRRYVEMRELLNPKISESSTYWHVDHTLRVIKGICKNLLASNPEEYSSKFNLSWAIIGTTGKIPRGKARAPKAVISTQDIHHDFLLKQINSIDELLLQIKSLPKKAHFNHPVFGVLDLRNARKFLKIHTNHHLKIMHDITK